jgi:molybdopterin synthase sulfur carrier subunit
MSRVSVLIPQALRPLAGGASVREVSAATVEEALNAIERDAPGFLARILTPEGEVRPLVNIFVGDTSIRERAGLATTLADGDIIAVIPAVAGG